ncbi:MAG: hypothetical protein ACI9MC_000088 [Kiritimatiellia bacterium]|jgi:hypothetical protein
MSQLSKANTATDWNTHLRGPSRRRRAPRWQLRLIHPRGVRFTLPLGVEPVTLGRGNPGDYPPGLPLPYISRKHAVLSWQDGAHYAIEQGSTNGTWLNGMRLHKEHPVPLAERGIIRILDALMVYEQVPSSGGADNITSALIPGASATSARLRQRLTAIGNRDDHTLLIGPPHVGRSHAARAVASLSGGHMIELTANHMSPADEAFLLASTHQQNTVIILHNVHDLAPITQRRLASLVTTVAKAKLICTALPTLQRRSLDGSFHRELYLALARHEVVIPTLQERRADLLQWIDFLHQRNATTDGDITRQGPLPFTGEALETMLLHPWSDNFEQLDYIVRTLSNRPSGQPFARSEVTCLLDETSTMEITQETRAPFAA